MSQPEKQVQNEILRFLATVPAIRCWRSNVVATKIRHRFIRAGVVGQPDICGLIGPSGRWLGIEVKANSAQSEQQRNFQAMIERFGGIYLLARSVDDVRAGLRRAGVVC